MCQALDYKRKEKRRKSEVVSNYKSREAGEIKVESKVESKIRFFSSVKVKLFKYGEDSPDSANKIKFVELK